jgi:hypothetical protein
MQTPHRKGLFPGSKHLKKQQPKAFRSTALMIPGQNAPGKRTRQWGRSAFHMAEESKFTGTLKRLRKAEKGPSSPDPMQSPSATQTGPQRTSGKRSNP